MLYCYTLYTRVLVTRPLRSQKLRESFDAYESLVMVLSALFLRSAPFEMTFVQNDLVIRFLFAVGEQKKTMGNFCYYDNTLFICFIQFGPWCAKMARGHGGVEAHTTAGLGVHSARV